VVEPILSGTDAPRVRRPILGYAMVLAATAMWGINGTVSKGIFDAGLSSPRLTELRSTGTAVALGLALLLTQALAPLLFVQLSGGAIVLVGSCSPQTAR
jgi:drug/metabolite transporter (DMT)-like permease